MKDLKDQFIENIILENSRMKDEFIKSKLIEKGYKHIIPTLKTRFPKINISRSPDGWEYVFADNGTVEGDFIVGISPWNFNKQGVYFNSTYTCSYYFNYTEALPESLKISK